jgi:5-methylthioadenosine/S-adenosylhomocysteine deaminase
VGDIDGRASGIAARELAAAGLHGVSYQELIGIGPARERAMATLDAASGWRPAGDGVRMGISPHAPYTCDLEIYRRAAAIDAPMATHLAETPGETPAIDQLADVLALRPLAAAHVNYAGPAEIGILAAARTTVVFCPRAAAYFGHRSHGWRRMIDAGVNVALGTDGAASNNRLDLWSELELAALFGKHVAHDATAVSAPTALSMATINGAKALNLDADIGSLAVNKAADVVCVELTGPGRIPVLDPVSQLVYASSRDQVTDVWVAGEHLVSERSLTRLDIAEIESMTREWAQRIKSQT